MKLWKYVHLHKGKSNLCHALISVWNICNNLTSQFYAVEMVFLISNGPIDLLKLNGRAYHWQFHHDRHSSTSLFCKWSTFVNYFRYAFCRTQGLDWKFIYLFFNRTLRIHVFSVAFKINLGILRRWVYFFCICLVPLCSLSFSFIFFHFIYWFEAWIFTVFL